MASARVAAALLLLSGLTILMREPDSLRALLLGDLVGFFSARNFPGFLAAMLIWVFGPGNWSLDRWIARRHVAAGA